MTQRCVDGLYSQDGLYSCSARSAVACNNDTALRGRTQRCGMQQ